MDLSPEERRRIYDEEKARLEATEQIKGERRKDATQKGCLGCLGLLAILAVLLVLASLSSHDTTPSSSSDPPIDQTLLSQAGSLIQDGLNTGILSEVSYESGYTRVVVGPAFSAIDFKAKEGFCRSISYVARSRGAAKDFILRDSRTNKDVGSFVSGMLTLK